MLIQCERHTKADLALWRDLEEADFICGERLTRSGKVEKALEIIRQFCELPAYGSTSHGKDSVVLAHLLSLAAPDIPLVHMVYSHGLPYLETVRDAYLSEHYHADYREFVAPNSFSASAGQKRQRFDIAEKALGISRYLSGIRSDEKGSRVVSIASQGLVTKNTCRPIGHWTTDEVFGYLAINHLPVHPNYAMLGGGRYDRNWLRVASLGGKRGTGMGRTEWEREYYSDIINRISHE